MIAVFELADAWSVSLLSLQICAILPSSLFLFIEWKEKWLGKILISLSLGRNSKPKELNKEKTLLSLLLVSTIGPLTFNCCLGVSFLNNKQ